MSNQSQVTRSVPKHWAAALAFNKALGIPARWKVAQKVSYRSGQGMCDYSSRSSSYHVLLLDDMKAGRIKRSKGQFLCLSKITDPTVHQVINMNELNAEHSKTSKVTCPKCLERAAKL
jgi:hypothetical protein